MHYTQYGTGLTFCGRKLGSPNAQKFTGLDRLVTCGDCKVKLDDYRRYFPQASNVDRRVELPNGDIILVATNEGGAR